MYKCTDLPHGCGHTVIYNVEVNAAKVNPISCNVNIIFTPVIFYMFLFPPDHNGGHTRKTKHYIMGKIGIAIVSTSFYIIGDKNLEKNRMIIKDMLYSLQK